MKILKIIIILYVFFISSLLSQTKVMFCEGSSLSHDSVLINSFKRGYSSFSGRIYDTTNYIRYITGDLGLTQYHYNYAKSNNYKILIRSYTGAIAEINLAETNYPDVLLIMPTGGYEHTQIITNITPELLLTGQGKDTNISSYNIEFHDRSIPVDSLDISNVPSFSNAYIAGKLVFIMDSLNCGIWEARYRARVSTNQTYTNDNGFGIINVGLALAYNGAIPEDPYLYLESLGSIGNLVCSDGTTNYIDLRFNAVTFATSYIIYRDGVIIDTTNNLYYLDNVPRLLRSNYYEYQYRAIGQKGQISEISESVQIKHRKYNKIYFK